MRFNITRKNLKLLSINIVVLNDSAKELKEEHYSTSFSKKPIAVV